MRILQVNTTDTGGGAETVARGLFQAYRTRGHWSRLAVGHKHLEDPDVLELPRVELTRPAARIARSIGGARLAKAISDPVGAIAKLRGSETVNSPMSHRLLELFAPERPQILHCHNLHGSDYFDIRALPGLSARVPVVLTLHDAWLLSGHCAHSLECDRWLIGCGHCPDLTLYPSIQRDATAENFARKRQIFSQTRVYVSAPSSWLLRRAERSHLAGSIIEGRVIPNGVDTRVFAPGKGSMDRRELGLPEDAAVILFVAPRGAHNQWKDHATLRAALERLGASSDGPGLLCLVLGNEAPTERVGRTEFRYLGAEQDPRAVARLYRAADLYVHATRVDTFPLTVLEALACGTPVIASAVGGIPEQVKHLPIQGLTTGERLVKATPSHATGTLVPPGDAGALAVAISAFLSDRELLGRLSRNARQDAMLRFDHESQVDRWLEWYEQITRAC